MTEDEALAERVAAALRSLVLSCDDRRADAMMRGEDTHLSDYEVEAATLYVLNAIRETRKP